MPTPLTFVMLFGLIPTGVWAMVAGGADAAPSLWSLLPLLSTRPQPRPAGLRHTMATPCKWPVWVELPTRTRLSLRCCACPWLPGGQLRLGPPNLLFSLAWCPAPLHPDSEPGSFWKEGRFPASHGVK